MQICGRQGPCQHLHMATLPPGETSLHTLRAADHHIAQSKRRNQAQRAATQVEHTVQSWQKNVPSFDSKRRLPCILRSLLHHCKSGHETAG